MNFDKPQHQAVKVWKKKDSKFSNVRQMMRTNDAIAMILEGKTRDEIVQYVITKYELSKIIAVETYARANSLITDRKQYEIDGLIDIHIERYEHIYSLLVQLGANGMAAGVLKAKERLLQFHKNNTHMRVDNDQFLTIQSMEVKADYDLSKLNKDQQDRFDLLLNKMKAA